MKKQLLTLLTFFVLNLAHGQVKNDSTPFGLISSDGALARKTLDYGSYASLPAHVAVLIGGTGRFQGQNYFKVFFRSKKYYVQADELISRWTFDEIESYSPEKQDSLSIRAEYWAKTFYVKELDAALAAVKSKKVAGLAVLNWTTYDESEYTDGTGVEVSVINPTAKTIKYIWFSFIGYNPVNDKVYSNGKSVKTMKAIGPIKPNGSATYKFEYMWMTDIVETSKLYSIKVQYMDGTFKTIANPGSVRLSNDVKMLFEETSDDGED